MRKMKTQSKWPILLVGFFIAAMPVAQAGVEISEFMAKNETTLATAAGAYADWVEIHNNSGSSVDLADYYLTDDPADLRKWQFSSTDATTPLANDGYLIVFIDDSPEAEVGDELHASFKLGAGGEYLALIEPDGETVAYQYNPEFPDQSADVSYGIDSRTGEHAYFAVPTPGTANGQAIANTVQFSVEGGTFTSPFSLTLSVPSSTAEIRYMLDGTLPTTNSSLYSSPLPIIGTTRVRARAFESGLVDGAIVSQSYIHLDASAAAFTSDLPLIVLDNFAAGDIPHPDSDTRQACQVLFFEPDASNCTLTNSASILSRAGIKRRGESSLRDTAEKPNLSLETWGEVDEDSRSIKPFGMPAESDWVLFAPWDFDWALMRNSFIYEVSNESGNYAVRTQFVEVFLNVDGGSVSASDYYGVYVFMEKIKQGSGRVDVVELQESATSEPEISGGYIFKLDKTDPDDQYISAAGKNFTAVDPNPLPPAQLGWISNHLNQIDALVPNGNYESMIDVDTFADHHILNVFANNADGLRLSTFYHKDRDELLKMGPIWDFDRSMGSENDARAVNPEVWSLATDSKFFFRNGGPLWFSLWSNEPDFWMVWADRWQLMRNGPLSEVAMNERIDRYQAELADAAIRNFERWEGHGGNPDPDHFMFPIPSSSEWTNKVEVFRNHVQVRGNWIDDQLVDPPVFNQNGGLVSSGFELSMTEPQPSYYTLDNSDPRASDGNPSGASYSSSITITENTLVKARAWNGLSFTYAPSTWPWSPLSEAMFVVDPAPLAITEIMYHPRPPATSGEMIYTASDFEFIEIQNTSASSCLLVGVQLLNGVEFDLTEASSASLGAGQYGVLVRNLEAFKVRYPSWASLTILGTYSGRLNDGGEQMKMGYGLINLLPLASFDYEDDWFPCTDGEGFSLVLNNAQSAPSSWDSKAAWRHSSGADGSPGVADPAPAYAPGTIVINEVLSHQDTDNPGDWIELHNTTGSPIDIGGWFLSDSRGTLMKYTIPAGTTVPANGYFVFTEKNHFGSAFALSEHGDSVYLSAGSGGALLEPACRAVQDFGGQERDVTFGRTIRSDGSATFPSMVSATMGYANSAPRIGPVVIQEIMYHPPFGGQEYLTLSNTSGSMVPLYDPANPSNTWNVSGIDFAFPIGVELTAGDSLLLIRDKMTPALFRSVYGVPESIEIFAYSGELDNGAETLVLKKPGTPEALTGYVPLIVVEQVKYNDSAPWPPEADGEGKDLSRISLTAYANDVANWQAMTASYGPPMYVLTVISGTGDGIYTEGSVVSIDAATTNLSFVQWIGNVSGVENIQSSLTSLTMLPQDITVSALYSAVTFFNAGAEWKYHDQGENLGTAWQSPSYDDSGWKQGAALLGYGEGDETTVVSYGGDSRNKYITTYFRKHFTVANAALLDQVTMELLRDDAAVVYINGVEVVRDMLPEGEINYLTLAPAFVDGARERTFYSFVLSPSVLVDGNNVIAVEIHQQAKTSSDISFDAELSGVLTVDTATADGDVDGMYDSWETNHFGSTEASLPSGDPDEDGSVNKDEFIAGTLPLEPSSFFRIDQTQDSEITWATVPGRTYSVYWTDDLETPFISIIEEVPDGRFAELYNSTNLTGFFRVGVGMD